MDIYLAALVHNYHGAPASLAWQPDGDTSRRDVVRPVAAALSAFRAGLMQAKASLAEWIASSGARSTI
jgi:hypothetical protein